MAAYQVPPWKWLLDPQTLISTAERNLRMLAWHHPPLPQLRGRVFEGHLLYTVHAKLNLLLIYQHLMTITVSYRTESGTSCAKSSNQQDQNQQGVLPAVVGRYPVRGTEPKVGRKSSKSYTDHQWREAGSLIAHMSSQLNSSVLSTVPYCSELCTAFAYLISFLFNY